MILYSHLIPALIGFATGSALVIGVSAYILKVESRKRLILSFNLKRTWQHTAKKRGYDGVICGHIHKAEIKEIDGVVYMNDGDWVESCTALVEHHNGRWEIITWTQERDDVVDDIDSSTRKRSNGSTRKDRVGVH
jgi:hypothetical protein